MIVVGKPICCIDKNISYRLKLLFMTYQAITFFLNTTVAYVTDRSKAVVRVVFLFFVALWFILRGASSFKVLPCYLSSCFFFPFSIVITPLGEEGAGLCASRRLFVCFARASFGPFSLPVLTGVASGF